MARSKITQAKLADILDVTPTTMSFKLSGRSSLSLRECVEIKRKAFPDKTLDYSLERKEIITLVFTNDHHVAIDISVQDGRVMISEPYAVKEDFCKKEYKKRGQELRWIRNIECTPSGNWHIHVVLNRIPDTDLIIAAAWKHGKVRNKQLLYEKGEFRKLAQYVTKNEKTQKKYVDASKS